MSTKPLDVKGYVMHEGDFVAYTTNAEGGGFDFGHIFKIYEKQFTDRNGAIDFSYKIVINKTDVNGQPKYEDHWDSSTRKWETTDKQQRSGRVDYRSDKFMILT